MLYPLLLFSEPPQTPKTITIRLIMWRACYYASPFDAIPVIKAIIRGWAVGPSLQANTLRKCKRFAKVTESETRPRNMVQPEVQHTTGI